MEDERERGRELEHSLQKANTELSSKCVRIEELRAEKAELLGSTHTMRLMIDSFLMKQDKLKVLTVTSLRCLLILWAVVMEIRSL